MHKSLFFFVLFSASFGAGAAADYFVSPTGSDTNPGTAPAQAWRTGFGGQDLHSFPATAAQLFGDGLTPKPGSPAIDAGFVLPDVPADILGACRPMGTSTDIGAREFYQTPFARFSGDNVTDLLWREAASGNTVIWALGDGLSVAGGAFLAQVAPEWGIAATADFDRNGITDLLWRNAATGDNAVWFLDGFTVRGTAVLPPVPVNWRICN
ncbi:MAG: hypothetical protein KA419_01000 [Acidobacteria bacterium]|nr:hypothetical protein [Acidobacteriota bacterium]